MFCIFVQHKNHHLWTKTVRLSAHLHTKSKLISLIITEFANMTLWTVWLWIIRLTGHWKSLNKPYEGERSLEKSGILCGTFTISQWDGHPNKIISITSLIRNRSTWQWLLKLFYCNFMHKKGRIVSNPCDFLSSKEHKRKYFAIYV